MSAPKKSIEAARATKMWLHSRYHDLWFTPDELEAENADGKFRWGDEWWTLRSPAEFLDAALARVRSTQAALFAAWDKVREWEKSQP